MSSNRRPLTFWLSAWLPVVIGLCVIVMESTEAFGSDHTSGPLRALFQAIFGHVRQDNWEMIHHLIRKSGHFIGYGLLGLAWLRAWWMTLPTTVFARCAALAMLGTALTASADEFHQSFLPNRTSSVWDVLLDCAGAFIMMAIVYLSARFFRAGRLVRNGCPPPRIPLDFCTCSFTLVHVNQPANPDPANYTRRRDYALAKQWAEGLHPAVQIVLMDWHTPTGIATALAAFDGAASVYMSDGNEFVGGGKKSEAIRDAAKEAVGVAGRSLGVFQKAATTEPPAHGEVCFYIRSGADLLCAMANEKELRLGTDALTDLGDAMQNIFTQYRLHQPQQGPAA